MTTSPFLLEKPRRVHCHWWTTVPALPTDPRSRAYYSLRRFWFDHTDVWTTTAAHLPPVPKFFVEGLEENLTPTLFQTWAALPGTTWSRSLLQFLGCSVRGDIQRISWSYQFVERGWDGMPDIVIHWEDEARRHITIVEAKRRGGPIGRKDLSGESYRTMPSLASEGAADFVLLIDEHDKRKLETLRAANPEVPSEGTKVVFWQDLIGLQISQISALPVPDKIKDVIVRSIVERASHLGFSLPECAPITDREPVEAYGTPNHYRWIASQELPKSIEQLLIGLDVVITAQRGAMPAAPYPWLTGEPTALDIHAGMAGQKRQGWSEWTDPVWHLDWRRRRQPSA